MVFSTSRPSKLSIQWIGPGKVKSKISETNYVVENPGKKDRTQIYLENMLKPYYTRPEHVNLLDFEECPKLFEEQNLDIPYLVNDPTLFNF